MAADFSSSFGTPHFDIGLQLFNQENYLAALQHFIQEENKIADALGMISICIDKLEFTYLTERTLYPKILYYLDNSAPLIFANTRELRKKLGFRAFFNVTSLFPNAVPRDATPSELEDYISYHRDTDSPLPMEIIPSPTTEFPVVMRKLTDGVSKLQYGFLEARLSLGDSDLNPRIAELMTRADTELESLKGTVKLLATRLSMSISGVSERFRILQRDSLAEIRFFNSARDHNIKTFNLTCSLIERLLTPGGVAESLNISNIPARALITAESATIRAAINAGFAQAESGYLDTIGWCKAKTRPYLSNGRTFYQNFSPDVKVLLGESEIVYEQRTDPHRNFLGSFFMHDLGSYQDIFADLNTIIGVPLESDDRKTREIALAKLMQKYCHDGLPVTLKILQRINPAATALQVTKINRIMFHCFVKEIAARLLQDNPEYQLPLATAQMRALYLLAEGKISMLEVFDKDASYGIFTGAEIFKNLDQLRDKILAIYESYVFAKIGCADLTEISSEMVHQELREGYGGEDDTDNEVYDEPIFPEPR